MTQHARFTAHSEAHLPLIAIDLGYSATARSCGLALTTQPTEVRELAFGACIEAVVQQLSIHGPQQLLLEAVLSTYHCPSGNPAIRGNFEKGRGWYHGPGVTTFAAALRFLQQLDQLLPQALRPIPITEAFLSYKKTRSTHAEDAQRMLQEFHRAERFQPMCGTEPLCPLIQGVPEIRRYNPPPKTK